MRATDNLLLRCLREPSLCERLSAVEWDLLIRQARAANLLAELNLRLQREGLIDSAPPPARPHLDAASKLVTRQRIAIRWEVECIRQALQGRSPQLAVLKGAAYLLRELPHAQSRIFTDVDILVPRAYIDEVESALLIAGWQPQELDAYNQRYYRRWMHEIPPLTHIRRGTSIDVHHAILPGTARLRVNTAALFEQLQPLAEFPGVSTLGDIDMLLHSATHLFHEGEFDNGLRDLFDLDAMLQLFGQRPGFWDELLPRAQQLGLVLPLFYALRYTERLLGRHWPITLMATMAAHGPGRLTLTLMDACYERALAPVHSSCNTIGVQAARLALYLRSHWLRMPPTLLALHLGRKAWMRLWGLDQPAEATPDDAKPR
ncbi:nucleotidyltransferase family protein [Paucibacter sp. APW11]|uniref:Nucleotidyltransferase family protein n=1 Tax=Roseateles aquae TaxID=3077235 RepID=A0ABU3PC80_9BURK|nr:nucleotidyltransferase family protein [Paucibacter sp. APW11]MDT9000138.1 nucleotidyltransferase family protein [Paucibacter sp. APW11]